MMETPHIRPDLSEIDATVGAPAVLDLAIERTPSAAKADHHRTAIRRHGRALAASGGSDMMCTVLRKIGELSPAYADARRAIIDAELARTTASIR